MKKIINFFKLFIKLLNESSVQDTNPPKVEVPPQVIQFPLPQPIVEQPKPKKELISLEIIRCLVVGEISRYVGAKEIGTNTDAGGIIDKIILTMGGELGWPWCAATVCYTVLQVCNKLQISYPKTLYRGFSSQAIKTDCDRKYLLTMPVMGSAFVHTNQPFDGHGHCGICSSDIYGVNYYTIEGNASNNIETRGDRSLIYSNVFVDISQAIYDQYKLENP